MKIRAIIKYEELQRAASAIFNWPSSEDIIVRQLYRYRRKYAEDQIRHAVKSSGVNASEAEKSLRTFGKLMENRNRIIKRGEQ